MPMIGTMKIVINKRSLAVTNIMELLSLVSFLSSSLLLLLLLLLTTNNNVNAFLSPSRALVPKGSLLPSSSSSSLVTFSPSLSTSLNVLDIRDADFIEMMVGGQRYEMVPLPDSMLDTTIFVGNLCEFAKDEDLSNLFQTVSKLQSVPACVARKANMNSLQYGFVSFPTVEEKEAAILRFHGCEWMGKCIKVEPIKDDPRGGRVRVPEQMVTYVSGNLKKTKDGRTNDLRRVERNEPKKRSSSSSSSLSNKKKKKKTMKKKIQMGATFATVSFNLSKKETDEFHRATKRGFVTLDSTGYRRGRKSKNALANCHRKWCNVRDKPQIILCRASGGRPLDNVIIDLSPMMHVNTIFGHDRNLLEQYLDTYIQEIVTAANNAGMVLRTDYIEDNTEEEEEEGRKEVVASNNDQESLERIVSLIEDNPNAWTKKQISILPVLSMGVFEGERSKAKAMVRELAKLWEIPEEQPEEQTNDRSSHDSKHRKKRGRNDKRQRRSGPHLLY